WRRTPDGRVQLARSHPQGPQRERRDHGLAAAARRLLSWMVPAEHRLQVGDLTDLLIELVIIGGGSAGGSSRAWFLCSGYAGDIAALVYRFGPGQIARRSD